MLSPLPRRSDWAYCFAHFTQPCQPSPIWQSGRPAHCPFRGLLGVHSRYGLHTRAVTVFRDTLSEGFSHFVTSIAAPVASGWSGCRVGFAPTGKRRLFTAHANFGHERLDRHYARGAIKLQRLRATWWGTNKTRLGLRCAETYGPRYFASDLLEAQAGRAYGPVARIACAICFPFTSAASTVPISRPAYSASPEKNTAPSLIFRSAVCACRVSGVA